MERISTTNKKRNTTFSLSFAKLFSIETGQFLKINNWKGEGHIPSFKKNSGKGEKTQ